MRRTYSEIHCMDKYWQHSSMIWEVGLNGWVFVYKLSGCGLESPYSRLNFRFWAFFELPDIQGAIECGLTLKHVRDMIRTCSKVHHTDKYIQHSSIVSPFWLNGWVFVYELSGSGFESRCSHLNSYFVPASSKEFLDIQATIEYGFTLKRVRDMGRTSTKMYRTDKYSQHSSIIPPLSQNGWVFVYELSGCQLESPCSHVNVRFRACFQQGVPWN